jgi:hypothetical protein
MRMMLGVDGMGMKPLAEFLRGGWREVPSGDRWWEDALGGLENARCANLAMMDDIKKGMNSAREFW